MVEKPIFTCSKKSNIKRSIALISCPNSIEFTFVKLFKLLLGLNLVYLS